MAVGIATLRRKLAALEEKTDDLNESQRFLQAVRDVESWSAECKRRFNSPEAKRIREAEYQKMLAEGEQRKQKFYEKWGE